MVGQEVVEALVQVFALAYAKDHNVPETGDQFDEFGLCRRSLGDVQCLHVDQSLEEFPIVTAEG